MERKTMFAVGGQFFETPEDKATVKHNLSKGKSVGVYLTDTSRTGHKDTILAPLTFDGGVVYIDKETAEVLEDGKEKYDAAMKAEEERQAQWVLDHPFEEVETLPVTE